MNEQEKLGSQSGGVRINANNVHVGGDVVGGDKITQAINPILMTWTNWQKEMNEQIDHLPQVTDADKKDLKEQIGKIQAEAAKVSPSNPERLEKLINTLAVMAPDIFEVALATLVNPLAGLGLVAKKIGDKAKLEPKTATA